MSKAGEGSRGGKVIGHTKGGKPIYEGKGSEHHAALIDHHSKQARMRKHSAEKRSDHRYAAEQHKAAKDLHDRISLDKERGAAVSDSAQDRANVRSNQANYSSHAAHGFPKHDRESIWMGKSEKPMDVIEEMDKLMKAANPGQIIGRTADGKEVYAHDQDVLQKPGAAKKASTVPPGAAAATTQKPIPKKPGEDDEEENGPGSQDHHKERALAHLQAAQAHAGAASSAKKVEEAKDHKGAVKDAQAASEATMADTQVKKSDRVIRKNNLHVNLDSEQQYLDLLEKGGEIGGQSAGLREDRRHSLLGQRGERLSKATIYQGEHDADGSRGADARETVARAQSYQSMMHMDPSGNDGAGGLPEWFKDSWNQLSEEAKSKVRQGMGGPLGTGWKKGGPEDELIILDDDTPYTRAILKGGQHGEHQSSIRLAYQGKGRENPK
jgi:hypothetical protein